MAEADKEGRAFVVVLGDLGRSPRMQYHAQSLSREGYRVTLVGYSGSELFPEVAQDPRVQTVFIPQTPDIIQKLPRSLGLALKAFWQLVTLLCCLPWWQLPQVLVLQNPPGLPAILACRLFCLLVNARLVLDWHNYGFSIMAQGQTGDTESSLVKVARWYEGTAGRWANTHLCVTKAMKEDLLRRWGITAHVLYDRPPSHFRPMESAEERVAIRRQLAQHLPALALAREDEGLLVSSTSWTPDEDFSMLMDALQIYEEQRELNSVDLPPLLCVVTGKGPLKEHYCRVVEEKDWKHVRLCTPWLLPEDYPLLLAVADLGVSLHTSSSGLDLPMKVVDMFGCGLPVCAADFPALNELVRHEENGLVFQDAEQLATQLIQWFSKHSKGSVHPAHKQKFRKAIQEFRRQSWHQCWTRNALPVIRCNDN